MVGLILLFLLLRTGVVRREYVEDTALYLIQIFPVMFLPITTALMVSYRLLEGHTVAFLAITLVSTVLIFLATGTVTQGIIHLRRKKGSDGKGDAA